MSDLDLSAGRAHEAAATTGEWEAGEPAWFRGRTNPEAGKRPITAGALGVLANVFGKADAELIVWLRNHAVALMDRAERAEAAEAALAEALAERSRWKEEFGLVAQARNELRVALARVQAENERLTTALRLDQPWPVHEVLRQLADAAEHGLKAHDCDHLGWELVQSAVAHARSIDAALSPQPPTPTQEGQ